MKNQLNQLFFVCLLSLSACAKPVISRYTIVLVQDSETLLSSSYAKAARLAIKQFNGKTNIQGQLLELEILDLAQEPINSKEALASYINSLEYKANNQTANNNNPQRSLLIGFVAAPSQSNQSIKRFIGLITQQVLLGHWEQPQNQRPKDEKLKDSFVLNTATPASMANRYLKEYIEEQGFAALYIVYDQQNRNKANNFAAVSPAMAKAVRLRYVKTGNNYAAGRIQSVGDLLRNQRVRLQNAKANSGILLFLSQQNAAEVNRYLVRSVYRNLFGKIDFILNGEGLSVSALPPADSPRYFVFRQFEEADRQQKYADFRYQYEKNYQLKAERELAQLFDEILLLAYSAKQTIEDPDFEETLVPSLYETLLQNRFAGVNGKILFDANGERMAVYQLLQRRNGRLEVRNYFPANAAERLATLE